MSEKKIRVKRLKIEADELVIEPKRIIVRKYKDRDVEELEMREEHA